MCVCVCVSDAACVKCPRNFFCAFVSCLVREYDGLHDDISIRVTDLRSTVVCR